MELTIITSSRSSLDETARRNYFCGTFEEVKQVLDIVLGLPQVRVGLDKER